MISQRGWGQGCRRGTGSSHRASFAAAAKTSDDDSTSQALFFGLGGSERAGGWRGQPLPDVDSVQGGRVRDNVLIKLKKINIKTLYELTCL